jgi:group II intron reverse transcriptase/maturase
MAELLSGVYEERFLDCSYGYRPNRSQHQAVKFVNDTVMSKKVGYVLEADIKGFFDNVNHDWLMKFLENDIEDKNFLRYIKRFLIAGIMENGERLESDKGTPQGGLISPILANVYLHYVLDLWVERRLKRVCKGEVHYVRYADDFILFFQHESEAKEAMMTLEQRLGEFGLELAKEKTRIIPFGRFKGDKDDFDFLGFTFYNTKSLSGKYRIGVRTSKKKLKAKRQSCKEWLRERIVKPIAETMQKLAVKLRGHYNYYGVNGNIKKLADFWQYTKETCFKMLNRRSQKRSMKHSSFQRIWDFYIPPPKLTVNIWNVTPKLV